MIDKPIDKVVDKSLSTPERIRLVVRNNPNITQPKLAETLKVSKTTLQNGISVLKKKGLIERVRSNKDGYWRVKDL